MYLLWGVCVLGTHWDSLGAGGGLNVKLVVACLL